MVRKAVFEELGGLSAQPLEQGLAELDLCLRAGRLGYLVVGTPHAVLLKSEPVASVEPVDQQVLLEQQQVFCERWLGKVVRDPAYNPSLGLATADFSLEPSLRGSWNPLCARAVPAVLGLLSMTRRWGITESISRSASWRRRGESWGELSMNRPRSCSSRAWTRT